MRITVIVSEAEWQELKRRAGLVPLSRWIRSELLDGMIVEGLEVEKSDEEIDSTPAITTRRHSAGAGSRDGREAAGDSGASSVPSSDSSNGGERSPTEQRIPRCPHLKERGSLCYKCDAKFGYPVIE